MSEDKLDLEKIEKKTLEQFKTGKSLFGSDGAFAPLLKSFITKNLEAEMEAYLDEEQRLNDNKRNGKGRKLLKVVKVVLSQTLSKKVKLF